ncbi:MAG: hypothetical protein M4D80_33740 [Myxococcota bacterium]|nr:hypothetical protein [Deltaproteobacteria bacterium]MDQ3340147.1 hypothetical protein [Myxococcota bacterium]
MNRVAAAVVSIALIGATLSPLLRKPIDDSYPLSTYPMFAWKRPTKLTMSYAIGETAAGERRYLVPRVLGSGEVLQARAIVERAVRKGGTELAAFCQRIAANVAQLDRFDDVARIRVMSGTHDSIEFLMEDKLGSEFERAKCEVKR